VRGLPQLRHRRRWAGRYVGKQSFARFVRPLSGWADGRCRGCGRAWQGRAGPFRRCPWSGPHGLPGPDASPLGGLALAPYLGGGRGSTSTANPPCSRTPWAVARAWAWAPSSSPRPARSTPTADVHSLHHPLAQGVGHRRGALQRHALGAPAGGERRPVLHPRQTRPCTTSASARSSPPPPTATSTTSCRPPSAEPPAPCASPVRPMDRPTASGSG
jgi:hypothetical protein